MHWFDHFLTKLSKYLWIKTGDRHYHFVEPWVIFRPFCRMETVYQNHFVEGWFTTKWGPPTPPREWEGGLYIYISLVIGAYEPTSEGHHIVRNIGGGVLLGGMVPVKQEWRNDFVGSWQATGSFWSGSQACSQRLKPVPPCQVQSQRFSPHGAARPQNILLHRTAHETSDAEFEEQLGA